MIIITGSIAYDYIMEFPGSFGDHILPDQTHNINLSFIVNKFSKARGGTAGNVSYSMGLLSTPHILYGVAGKDFSEYKKDFRKLKIDTSSVIIDRSLHTATGFAMTDNSNNQIWGYYYGAALNYDLLNLKNVAKKDDLVLIGPQGAKGSLRLIRQAVKLGIDYIFDPGFILTEVETSDLEYGIANAKIIIGNEYEIELIKTRVKNWKKIFDKKTVITTLGEKGAIIQTQSETIKILPVKAEKVLSTTGAGDAWRGGFLSGLERGYSLKTCGQMGSVASFFVLDHYGTQDHFYTKAQFKNKYRQIFKESINF